MIRIGVIYLGRRGSGGLISLNMAVQLARQASIFAVLSAQTESLEAWQKSGIEQVVVQTYQSYIGAFWSWVDRRQVKQIANQIRNLKPDVLIFPMFYTLNPLLQRHLAGIPSLVAVHDPVPHPGLVGKAYRVLEDLSIHQASRCIVFSQAFKSALQKRGITSDRVFAIPHGELAYLPPSDQAEGSFKHLHKDRLTLLFFGRITEYKGLEVLLDAYRIVNQDLPLRLLIVGEGDLHPYQSRLKKLEEVEIVNRWIAESEVWQFFSQADIVVLPYTSGSQSGIIPAAASYALPVIATRVGGLPEQIEDGRTGLLVEPASIDQLAHAIRKLADNPSLGKDLGSALQKMYKEEFSWEKIASQILSACEELMSR